MVDHSDSSTNPRMKLTIARGIDAAPVPTLEALRDRLRPELTCGVCRDLLCEPTAFDCGHMFCAGCANASMARNGGFLRCPACRKNVSSIMPAQTIGAVVVAVFDKEYSQELRDRASLELIDEELKTLRAKAGPEAARLYQSAAVTAAADEPMQRLFEGDVADDNAADDGSPRLMRVRDPTSNLSIVSALFAIEKFLFEIALIHRSSYITSAPLRYNKLWIARKVFQNAVQAGFIIVQYAAVAAVGVVSFRTLVGR
jgi:hypothetical protein